MGLMQKDTVRSSKLRKLRNFEIRIRNLGKNPVKFCRHRKVHNSVKFYLVELLKFLQTSLFY